MSQTPGTVLTLTSYLTIIVAIVCASCLSALGADNAPAIQITPETSVAVPRDIRLPGTRPVYAVPNTDSPPKIDGRLDDACWQSAPCIDRFYLDTDGSPMTLPTIARMVRDDTYLYLAVDCTLPGASSLPLKKGMRDNISWGGETIELFLHADRSSPEYVQVIFDMTGAFTDQIDGDIRWNGDITAATNVTKTGWQLEAKIRIADLARPGKLDKSLWGANICRSTQDQSGSWAGLRDSFQQPDAFGHLTFLNGHSATKPEESEPFLRPRLIAIPNLPAADFASSDGLTCALRPVTSVATSADQAAVWLIAQSTSDHPQELAGQLTVRAFDSHDTFAIPVTLRLPPKAQASRCVPLPIEPLKLGQYEVRWSLADASAIPVLQARLIYNPLQAGWLKDFLTPPLTTDVLQKLHCCVPGDPADRAVIQVRIDRLADYVYQQLKDPKLDLSGNIRTSFEQLMDLVNLLRDSQSLGSRSPADAIAGPKAGPAPASQPAAMGSYTAQARGWFEGAIYSPVDDSAQPYSLFVPYDYDDHPDRTYSLVVNLHAGGGSHGGAGYRAGLDRDTTDRIILRPLGRGGGSVSEGVPANDVLNQIRDVMRHFRVDPDAIHVYGGSAGGFGSFTLGATFPDVFATCMSFCGGGRFACVEQMSNLPTFVHHGLDDVTVSANASQFTVLRMQAESAPVQFYLHAGIGHNVGVPGIRLSSWETLRRIRRDPCPQSVVLAGGIPQAKHAYWLSILRFQDIHQPPYLRAEFTGRNHLALTARNVLWARISLPCKWIDSENPLQITIASGRYWTEVSPGTAKDIYIRIADDKLEATVEPPADLDDQTAYIGGGAASLFFGGQPIRIVYGTTGPAEQTAALARLASDIRRFNLGGADSDVGGYPVFKDEDLTEETLKACNLIVLGTPRNNSLLARMASALPAEFGENCISIRTDPPLSWSDGQVAFSLFYRNPLAPERRIWWFAGVDSRKAFDRLTMPSISRLIYQCPPELVVQSKSSQRVVATAYLDSQWHLTRPAPLSPAKSIWPGVNDLMADFNEMLTNSFSVDLGLVCRPMVADLFDWDSLSAGEAAQLVPAESLVIATVSGQGLLKGREASLAKPGRLGGKPFIAWAGPQPESIDPQSDYRVLMLPGSLMPDAICHECFHLRDCRLVPAESVEPVRQRFLRKIQAPKMGAATQPATGQ